MISRLGFISLLLAAQGCSLIDRPAQAPALELNQSAETIADAIQRCDLTSESLIRASLSRIAAVDRQGPEYRSILSLNDNALAEAQQLDAEAAQGRFRGRLHGLPILVKDTIETRELPTTAGSLALAENDTGRDAPIIARLKAEGAIILGKTNLSEWSNFRSGDAIAGWSALGGQTRNAVAPDHSPCGSSAGSAVAIAAFLAPLAIGVETNGSIVCPAAYNGIVGFKPTVGLVSRTYVIPISQSQDSIGPMSRTVRDAALLLNVMAGTDPADPATREADARKADYLELIEHGVRSLRIGVFRWAEGQDENVSAAFNAALQGLQAQGAELVDINVFNPDPVLWRSGERLLLIEFKHGLNSYLASTADQVEVRSLEDLIAFNLQHADRELALFDQSNLIEAVSAPGIDDPEYIEISDAIRRAAGQNGIDNLLASHNVSVLVMPSAGLPNSINRDARDEASESNGPPIGATWLPAMAGYPTLSVPAGNYRGLPIGVLVTGTAWDDALVLRVGRTLEQVIMR